MTRLRARHLVATLVLVAAVVSVHPSAADELTGTVRRVAGTVLLVETSAGLEIVSIGPAATITGAIDFLRIAVGDPVRVEYSDEVAGVKIADVVGLAPEANTDQRFSIEIGEFRQLMGPAEDSGGVTVIDARPRARFDAGHIPGALSGPATNPESLPGRMPAAKDSPLVFYSEGPRCDLAHRGVRAALALGYTDARSLRGGLPAWVTSGGYLAVEVSGASPGILGGSPAYLPVDVREDAESGAETLPGSIVVPLEAMPRQDFLGESWMPPFLFVGEDGSDLRPYLAAKKVTAWRSTDAYRAGVPVYVLAGGFAAWKAAGQASVPLRDAPTSVVIRADEKAGTIPFSEFTELWMNHGNADTLLLDVRDFRTEPEPWVTHIPLEELHERVGELGKDREIVVFCYAGNRSAIARLMLTRLGYRSRHLAASPEAALGSGSRR